MAKLYKTYGVKYGVIITKPWSNEMYDHNDTVSEEMKKKIKNAVDIAYDSGDIEFLKRIAKLICYYGFGDGYDLDDIYKDTLQELEQMANYQLHEVYTDMEGTNYVPKLDEYLIGYDD